MWEVEERFQITLGGSTYINTPKLIVYKGATIFKVERHAESGQLSISFPIYDEKGTQIGHVKQNRVFVSDHYKGDKRFSFEGSPHDWVFREEGSGEVFVAIKKKEAAAPAELEFSGRLYMPDGFLLEFTPEKTNIGGVSIEGSVIMDCGVGINIE